MATYSRYEVVTKTIQYKVPADGKWGAALGEVQKAVAVALVEYRKLHGLPDSTEPFDNWLRFFPGDDEIIIQFEVEKNE